MTWTESTSTNLPSIKAVAVTRTEKERMESGGKSQNEWCMHSKGLYLQLPLCPLGKTSTEEGDCLE